VAKALLAAEKKSTSFFPIHFFFEPLTRKQLQMLHLKVIIIIITVIICGKASV